MNITSNLSPLDKFGKLIVQSLRDRALEQNEMLLRGQLKGLPMQHLQERIAKLSPDEKALIHDVVVDLLDTALHDVLFSIQEAHDSNSGIEILVDGQNVAEISGMLNGELLGPDGWISKFSRFPVKAE